MVKFTQIESEKVRMSGINGGISVVLYSCLEIWLTFRRVASVGSY